MQQHDQLPPDNITINNNIGNITSNSTHAPNIPVIDISPLLGYIKDVNTTTWQQIPTTTTIDQILCGGDEHNDNDSIKEKLYTAIQDVATQINNACRNVGFFYISYDYLPKLIHLVETMESAAHTFFDQPTAIKNRIAMPLWGKSWRGYFRVGDELTSGKPDVKEGLYLSLDSDHNTIPMHGHNPFPHSGAPTSSSSSSSPPLTTSPGAFSFESTGKNPDEVLSTLWAQTESDVILQTSITEYLMYMKTIGYALLEGISLSLDINIPNEKWGGDKYLKQYHQRKFLAERLLLNPKSNQLEPLGLFRIFNYPSLQQYQQQYDQFGFITNKDEQNDVSYKSDDDNNNNNTTNSNQSNNKNEIVSVGLHNDYGQITILHQDQSGGLQVKAKTHDGQYDFIDAVPIKNTFVINIGDIIEKITAGVYLSTPHRVVNKKNGDRISFPFFFDPFFEANIDLNLFDHSNVVQSVLQQQQHQQNGATALAPTSYKRWDGREVGLQSVVGTYGDYILSKVSKVFPQLAATSLEP